ncbi:hypothetical protein like AT1G43760 [Hibiscus trionum]|uniref:Endonuclease/exonuclease/phosphatase n=1 Tax=Hibiscus trionum TaxID=183268 RepID=A0A9W7IDH3_HIBTR|nr:hypothetical protein like AT1G43760 [Hibiscus trionum]
MRDFDEFIGECNLVDLPLSNGAFTWFRGVNSITASRSDRFLISPEIIVNCPNLVQKRIPRSLSDHSPILLRQGISERGPQPFKFFDYWADDPSYDSQVKAVMSGDRSITETLRSVKAVSKEWIKKKRMAEVESVGDMENKIDELEKLASTDCSPSSNYEEIKKLKATLWERYRTTEREWLQKSRLKWFHQGNKNTKFFHATTSLRRSRNEIQCLRVGNRVTKDPTEIRRVIMQHFRRSYNKVPSLPVASFDV